MPPLPCPLLTSPRLSVVICNYNYRAYIAGAIESVLGQTQPADEIIVVDDGSTDGSLEVIETFRERGVRVIAQANGGQVAAYNTGFNASSGDVILFLDSDDELLPDALHEVASRFAEGIVKVHFRLKIIYSDRSETGAVIPHSLADGEVTDAFLKHGIPHASPPASGNAYRRSALKRIFPLPQDAQDRHGADFFCIYGATLFGKVASCDRPLGLYRVHFFPRQQGVYTFGNAEKDQHIATRVQRRSIRFAEWIADRTNNEIRPGTDFLDFSVEKSIYASTLLNGRSFLSKFVTALSLIPRISKSIVYSKNFRPNKKIALLGWVMFIAITPAILAKPAAKYVCDPGSRSA